MEQANIIRKKVTFGNDNEVKGWFKLTDGTKTNFEINEGELKQWGTATSTDTNPFLLGLLEMLYSEE
jgi:hypothetical protein